MRNLAPSIKIETPATVKLDETSHPPRLALGGEWIVAEAARMDVALRALKNADVSEVIIDGSAITLLDSAGSWLILRLKRGFESRHVTVRDVILPEHYRTLFNTLETEALAPETLPPYHFTIEGYLERIGRSTVQIARQTYDLVGFLGRVSIEAWEAITSPRRELPFPAFIQQIEETGLAALPIVGMLAFLLGIVLAYQGADQLKRFSAQIYTIDFLGVGFLRELGGLVTAIIIAGRSGSAFTAQIGTMRVNEETDAMQTIGLNVAEILVLPRVLGLVVALPLLTFYADVVGIIGGMVMTYFDLGITFPAFMRELESAITLRTLLVGLIKAPVFAFVIALVGCFEGLRVERNAASVGRLTTRSVVESIFLIIALDAGFSVLFSVIGF
ncbi:MAG TPA: MlaE family lipid ABC transporter permease subunit [Rhizomicrobium sp.]|jgi:phospholipid/cholesterol/gamma-HCH transport system permease protein|nr:MlaE family lipid ABC transporter permease subunit [Rhizomicrobium sp.]